MPYRAKVARNVLDDCRYALTELRNDPQGAAYRVRWFGAIAMLRAVWHVLKKVDAKSHPEIREAFSDWCKKLDDTKPNPPIYWQFIVSDRDALLKEYDYRGAQNVTVTIGGPTIYTYGMRGGPFHGQDQRDVYQQAIGWWEQQLTDIETDAGRWAPSP
jgi:hypothetical protein